MLSRMSWLFYIVKSFGFPPWVNIDDVACDVAGDISIALRNYDKKKSSVSTYMYQIASVKSKVYAASQSQEMDIIIDANMVAEDETPDPSDLIEKIRHVFSEVELNEHSRLTLDRMLKGASAAEIGRQLGWKPSSVKKRMDSLRKEIAWRLIKAGSSASPWIPDCDLRDLARKHERERGWLN